MLDGLTKANDMTGRLPFGPRAKTVEMASWTHAPNSGRRSPQRNAEQRYRTRAVWVWPVRCLSGGRYALVSESMGQGAEGGRPVACRESHGAVLAGVPDSTPGLQV